MIRSCYKADMNFFIGSNVSTRVQWYFVPVTNPTLPYETAFYSRIYEREELPPEELGEQYHNHPWRGGLPPKPVSVGGICGTPDQWKFGCLDTDPIPPDYPNTQIPVCCNPPQPGPLLGGPAIGGQLSASASAAVTGCLPCPVAPLVWRLTIVGLSTTIAFPGCTDCETTNGRSFLMSHVNACTWVAGNMECGSNYLFGLVFVSGSPGHWELILGFGNSTQTILSLVGSTFACLGLNTFIGSAPNDVSHICWGAAITAAIVPA